MGGWSWNIQVDFLGNQTESKLIQVRFEAKAAFREDWGVAELRPPKGCSGFRVVTAYQTLSNLITPQIEVGRVLGMREIHAKAMVR